MHIGKLTALRKLLIFNSKHSAKALVHLKGLKNLRELELSNDPLTADSVPILLGFRSLRVLSANLKKLSPAARKRLEQGLPKCKIR